MIKSTFYSLLLIALTALVVPMSSHAQDEVGTCPDDWERFFEPDPELYPFDSNCFIHELGVLHYVDEGDANSEETILFVHGNPSWSILHQTSMQAMIEEGHRVISLDNFGFGLSDKPHPDDFSYTPRDHSEILEQLVVALNLDNITIVVHDWGGPIGLGMAGRQPDRIANIVITNTWAWDVNPEDPGLYYALADWGSLAQERGDMLVNSCTMPRNNAEAVATAYDPSEGELYARVISTYLAPWFDPETGEERVEWACVPTIRLAQSILGDVAFLQDVEAGLANLTDVPYSFVVGQADPLFGELHPDRMSESLCPEPYIPVCDPEMLILGTTCSEDITSMTMQSSPGAYVCRTNNDESIFPYIDTFTQLLGEDDLVSIYTPDFPSHFVSTFPEGSAAIVDALNDLIENE